MAKSLKAKVTHYFDKIGVAVLEVLEGELGVGETVSIGQGDQAFDQVVSSMEWEKQPIERAIEGSQAAIKVDKPVKSGMMVVAKE